MAKIYGHLRHQVWLHQGLHPSDEKDGHRLHQSSISQTRPQPKAEHFRDLRVRLYDWWHVQTMVNWSEHQPMPWTIFSLFGAPDPYYDRARTKDCGGPYLPTTSSAAIEEALDTRRTGQSFWACLQRTRRRRRVEAPTNWRYNQWHNRRGRTWRWGNWRRRWWWEPPLKLVPHPRPTPSLILPYFYTKGRWGHQAG